LVPLTNNTRLLDFASDLCNGDPAILTAVRRWLVAAPTSNEEIGFHGDPDAMPPEWRQWLATVSLLTEHDYIMSFEDKYSDEIVEVWDDMGVLEIDALPEAAQELWRIIGDGVDYDDDGNQDTAQFETIWQGYSAATAAVEAAISASGKTLVSIDATDGDTMFFAVLDPAIALRWVGTGFAVADSYGSRYEAGVRPPMWDRLWEHLLYALGDVPEDIKAGGLPPGIASPAPLRF
jgi:hypothetical protein